MIPPYLPLESHTMIPEQIRARLDFSDEQLLAECEVHIHRTGGPGGQHRNKVATAIRLVHKPSGLIATAGETRSQHENKEVALVRLREQIAVAARVPLAEPIVWPPSVRIAEQRLRVSDKNPAVHFVIAIVLDSLHASGGRLAQAAAALGVSSSSLTRFLADHPRAWTSANAIRQAHGLGPLKS